MESTTLLTTYKEDINTDVREFRIKLDGNPKNLYVGSKGHIYNLIKKRKGFVVIGQFTELLPPIIETDVELTMNVVWLEGYPEKL